MAIKLQPDKDRDKYLGQIYGGSPPSMDYYRQLGATKRANEEAAKEAARQKRAAESASKKATKDAEKKQKDAEKEAKKVADKKKKEDEEKKKQKDILDLLGNFNQNSTAAPVSKASPSTATATATEKKSGSGFFGNLAGLGKDVLGNVLHVGSTAAKGVGQLAKVAFSDYTMKDMRDAADKQAKVNKEKYTPYSDKHSSPLSSEVHRALDRAGNAATFGLLEDSRRNLNLGTKAFDGRSGGGAGADVAYDLLGSLAPGARIAQGLNMTRLGANVTKNMSVAQKAAQRAKEGAIAGGIYGAADAGMSEALDPNRRNFSDHARNITLETLFGGVADPAIGGIFDALGKGAKRSAVRGMSQLPPLQASPAGRELVGDVVNPNIADVRNVLNQAPQMPDINLGPNYRSIPTVTQPEFNINRNEFFPDAQARQQQIDELLPQKQQLETTLNESRKTFVEDFLDRYQTKNNLEPPSQAAPAIPEPNKPVYEGKLYQGRGKDASEIYSGTQHPIAGEGEYFALNDVDARKYGDNVTEQDVKLYNPIVIRNDAEWRELVQREVGWKFPNITGLPDAEAKASIDALKKHLIDKGYDGLVIEMDKTGDMSKTLKNVFSHDQVVVYKDSPLQNQQAPASTPATAQKQGEQIIENAKEIADGEMQWEAIKQQRVDYANIRKKIDKFYIPKEFAEDYRGLFPRSFLASSDVAGIDVFGAAQAFGFSGDHEGVLQFGQMLRGLQESMTIKKGDIVPKPIIQEPNTLSSKEIEEVRKIGDAAFPETEDFQAINPLLEAFDADIADLENPNLKDAFNVNASAPKQKDPLAELAELRKQQPEPPAPTKPPEPKPSSTPEPSDGVTESPIERREETSLFEKIKGIPRLLLRGKNRAKYELVSEYQPAKDIEEILAKLDTDEVLARTPHKIFNWKNFKFYNGDVSVSDSLFKALRNAGRASRIAAESIEKGYAPIVEAVNSLKLPKTMKVVMENGKRVEKQMTNMEIFEDYVLAKHAKDILDHNAAKAKKAQEILTKLQDTKIGSDKAAELEAQLEPLKNYLLPKEANPTWVEQTIKKWEGYEEMGKAQKAFVKEQQKDLIMLHVTGRYSKAQIDAMMKEHPNYISMRRNVDEDTILVNRGTGSSPGRVGEPFKKRKEGSLDKVLPPLESAMQNRIRAIDTSMKNQALQKLEKMFTIEGAENFFRPIKKTDPMFDRKNAVRFFKDGQEIFYEVNEELARMFGNMGKSGVDNVAFKALEQLAVFSKKGMTHYNPTFLVKSPVRDTVNAIFTSRTGMSPIDVIGGFLDSMAGKQLSALTGGKFESYNDIFKAMGGDFSSFISMDIDDLARVQKAMLTGKVEKGFELINPFKMMEGFGAAMERAPRLAEFRSAKRKGYSDEDAIFEATDVIDYSDLGATIKKLNRVAPYLGATIRGNIRVLQAFKENPVKAVGRGVLSITLPTLGLYALRFHENVSEKQQAKIQNMPDWQKNTFWVIPDIAKDSDKIYMIPKGFLVTQIFANPVERALDQIYSGEHKTNDKLMKETIEDFKTALSPPTAIAGITTISQVARNQDDFLGIPIENEDMQEKPRRERFDSRTSELSKVTGKMFGLSPAKLDFVIKGMTGGLGRDVLDLSDNLAKEAGVDRPAKTRTNAEIINPFDQFTYDDQGSSRYAEELYQADRKEASKKSEIRADFKSRTSVSMPSDDKGRSDVGKYYDLFRDINREIGNVREDRVMAPAEKRDKIASLRDEQRELGVRLTDQGVLANQDKSLQEMEKHLNELGLSAKATKGDVRDVLRTQLHAKNHDRQKVEQLLEMLDKEQMLGLLEQMR